MPTIKTIETVTVAPKLVKPTPPIAPLIVMAPEVRPKEEPVLLQPEKPKVEIKKTAPEKVDKSREKERDSPSVDKRKRDRSKDYKPKPENRDRRSIEREKKRDRDSERVKKRSKYSKEELENEIISLVDNSDDMIDLTGDLSDTKGKKGIIPYLILASQRG